MTDEEKKDYLKVKLREAIFAPPSEDQRRRQRDHMAAIREKYKTPPEYEGNPVYREGREAYRNGHNWALMQPAPYDKGTPEYEAWVSGYMIEAKMEAEIDEPIWNLFADAFKRVAPKWLDQMDEAGVLQRKERNSD